MRGPWSTKKFLAMAAAFALLTVQANVMADERHITGRVVDGNGEPVEHASVSPFWRANGSPKRPDGSEYELTDTEQNHEFWGHVGEMEPWQTPTETDANGKFAISVPSRTLHLMALDADRSRGGIIRVPNRERIDDVQIQIETLTEVTGLLQSDIPAKSPGWTHVYVELERDDSNPLSMRRLVSCGSFDARFCFHLPPGNYRLDAYGISDVVANELDLQATPAPRLKIDGKQTHLDLGKIKLHEAKPGRAVLEKTSKAEGRWHDFTKHFGEPAPHWHAVDARGSAASTNVDAFRGKWLMIYFWGLDCAPCLSSGMPRMLNFYEEHELNRDRFEIVGICIDIEGEINTLREIDHSLLPIIKNVWDGRLIEFPVFLDNTFQSWERYGIPGLGTVVLVDPKGHLFKGDDKTLDRILREGLPPESSE